MWFWQTSCVGGSERSSTNVKLDEQELQSLGLKYYKNSFKSMEVSSRNIQRTLWSTVRPSIRKFLNWNPLLTSGTLVKD